MQNHLKPSYSIFIIIIILLFFGNTESSAQLILNFINKIGDQNIQVDSGMYTNSLGQMFTITQLRYYISNISVTGARGKRYEDHGYYLVDAADDASKYISLTGIPVEGLKTIEFLIGVDSLHNCSGAQSGALDPIKGMFWTWNSGYIFLKMEGKSVASKSPGGTIEYHIGGYMSPNNCIRKIELAAGREKKWHSNDTISIVADLAKMLYQPLTIDFSKCSSVTDFHGASQIADRYATMFSIDTTGQK